MDLTVRCGYNAVGFHETYHAKPNGCSPSVSCRPGAQLVHAAAVLGVLAKAPTATEEALTA